MTLRWADQIVRDLQETVTERTAIARARAALEDATLTLNQRAGANLARISRLRAELEAIIEGAQT